MRIGKSVLFLRQHCNRVDLSKERERLETWLEEACLFDQKITLRLELFVERAESVCDPHLPLISSLVFSCLLLSSLVLSVETKTETQRKRKDLTIRSIKKIIDSKLVHHLIEAFSLMDHLSAIKKLILLQQGDFSQLLISLLTFVSFFFLHPSLLFLLSSLFWFPGTEF